MTGGGGRSGGGGGRVAGGMPGIVGAGGIVLAGVALVALLVLVFGNGTTTPVAEPGGSACRVMGTGPLPPQVHETSGVARGVANPDLLWTHNDSGGDPVLFALGGEGRLAGAVRVRGASLVDWEDIEAAPCPDAEAGCLYIADTGDNGARRGHVTVYRVPEPGPGDAAVQATALRARYPDGPRDAEGLFMAGGRLHVVTKGREGPIRVYRFPADADPAGAEADAIATLEPVAEVAPRPETTADYVTAATASADGRWIALRTYRSILLFEAEPLLSGQPGTPRRYDLAPLAEAQGEGIALGEGGEVWLTSEAGRGTPPRWTRLLCEMPASQAGAQGSTSISRSPPIRMPTKNVPNSP